MEAQSLKAKLDLTYTVELKNKLSSAKLCWLLLPNTSVYFLIFFSVLLFSQVTCKKRFDSQQGRIQEGRQGRPPRSKFFHFYAVFGKKFANPLGNPGSAIGQSNVSSSSSWIKKFN